MNNSYDLMYVPDIARAACGGTELMLRKLYSGTIPRELLEKFQIIPGRISPDKPLDDTKVKILYCHDLPGDPATDVLKNEGWKKFHRIVFVSNWQMQAFINHYQIPWQQCVVIQNAIEPLPAFSLIKDKEGSSKSTINIGYWSTPHRGLAILIPVFKKLAEKYPNIHLHVASSFGLYGWEERDKPFQPLFNECKNHKQITYYNTLSNVNIRYMLEDLHILAYPSIWMETSCLVLMEAMSAGLLCVHSNLGALPETAANWTNMYQFSNDPNYHANLFYMYLENTIQQLIKKELHVAIEGMLQSQKQYADHFYSWKKRQIEWMSFLTSLQDSPPISSKEMFTYTIG